MKKGYITEAIILAIGIIVLGFNIKGGIDNFVDKDRIVTVKGLAEREVPASRVTWPIVIKDMGNDLPSLYTQINTKNEAIIRFLTAGGIAKNEIVVNPPSVYDKNAEMYEQNNIKSRYNITSVITITTDKVDAVRNLISRQGELLKDGIAILNDYSHQVKYEYLALNEIKPEMVEEANRNAKTTAEQFAKSCDSNLGKIVTASQGQFSIDDRDETSPHIKHIRVVTTITYRLKD
ncbi:MAG: SIMPL domain-containing protein [Muribaculaceae bacterium]